MILLNWNSLNKFHAQIYSFKDPPSIYSLIELESYSTIWEMDVELKDFSVCVRVCLHVSDMKNIVNIKKATRRRWEENEWGNYGNFPLFRSLFFSSRTFLLRKRSKKFMKFLINAKVEFNNEIFAIIALKYYLKTFSSENLSKIPREI